MKFILLTAVLISLTSQAQVEREFINRDQIRLTFSGDSIDQFLFLNESIKAARSTIRSKCFEEITRGDFGEPIKVEKCALILDRYRHFDYLELNRTNPREGNIIKILESQLIDEMQLRLRNDKKKFATILTREIKRRCVVVNANPSCTTFNSAVKKYKVLGRTRGEIKQEGSILCVDKVLEQDDSNKVEGCFLTPSIKTRSPQLVEIEEIGCNLHLEGVFNNSFKPNETITKRFYVNTKGEVVVRRSDAPLSLSRTRAFNLNLKDYKFFGKDVHQSDFICSSQQSNLRNVVTVTCQNISDNEYHIGYGRNSSLLSFSACNYPGL